MATIVSVTTGNNIVYTITDVAGNTGTVTATTSPSIAGTIAVSVAGLLVDGLRLLDTLLQMLDTGLRPKAIPNTNASFSN